MRVVVIVIVIVVIVVIVIQGESKVNSCLRPKTWSLTKIRWGLLLSLFLLLSLLSTAKVKSTPSPRPKTGVRQYDEKKIISQFLKKPLRQICLVCLFFVGWNYWKFRVQVAEAIKLFEYLGIVVKSLNQAFSILYFW